MNINICVIGGGSRVWALQLMKDLAFTDELSGIINLYDIDHDAAKKNEAIGRTIFKHQEVSSPFDVRYCKTAEEALYGSDFVIFSIEPGLIEMRHIDLVLPEQYGILQTVGDTTGPGGVFRAQRSIPIFRKYAKLIMKLCPDAWVINYTNPMTLCTWALYKEEPKIKAIGCCHEVFATQNFLAEKVSEWFGVKKPDRREIQLDICGINHFTFAVGAAWNGKDLYPGLLKLANDPNTFGDFLEIAVQRTMEEKWFDSDKLIALDFLKNFGVLGAAGDRHLAEFVPWYLQDERELNKFGVILTPYEWRIRNDNEKKSKIYTDEELKPEKSDEEGIDIIKAILGIKPLYTNINVPNKGQIPWLPDDHIVESNAYFSKNSVVPSSTKEPSSGVRSLISQVASVQSLILDGVFQNDPNLIFQGFISDPLMRLPLPKAKELFNKMYQANVN